MLLVLNVIRSKSNRNGESSDLWGCISSNVGSTGLSKRIRKHSAMYDRWKLVNVSLGYDLVMPNSRAQDRTRKMKGRTRGSNTPYTYINSVA